MNFLNINLQAIKNRKTGDRVASFLRTCGITGKIGSCQEDPISNYLKSCGVINPNVEHDTIDSVIDEDYSEFSRTTKGIREFIENFENRQYPYLISN